MTFADFLKAESVLVPIAAPDRDAAIAQLVDALDPSGALDRAALKTAMLAREASGSTGIGHGVAIPHARSPKVYAPRLAAGRAQPALDFKAADAEPVTLLFLLAVPEADPKSHLKVLAALSRMASDKKLLSRLNASKSPKDFYSLIAGLPV